MARISLAGETSTGRAGRSALPPKSDDRGLAFAYLKTNAVLQGDAVMTVTEDGDEHHRNNLALIGHGVREYVYSNTHSQGPAAFARRYLVSRRYFVSPPVVSSASKATRIL